MSHHLQLWASTLLITPNTRQWLQLCSWWWLVRTNRKLSEISWQVGWISNPHFCIHTSEATKSFSCRSSSSKERCHQRPNQANKNKKQTINIYRTYSDTDTDARWCCSCNTPWLNRHIATLSFIILLVHLHNNFSLEVKYGGGGGGGGGECVFCLSMCCCFFRLKQRKQTKTKTSKVDTIQLITDTKIEVNANEWANTKKCQSTNQPDSDSISLLCIIKNIQRAGET